MLLLNEGENMKNPRKYRNLSIEQIETKLLNEKISDLEKETLISEFATRRADQLLQQVGFTPNHMKHTKWRTINVFITLIALFLPWFSIWGESLNGFQVFRNFYFLLGQIGNLEADNFLMVLLLPLIYITIFLGMVSLFIYSAASLLISYKLHNLLRTRFWNTSILILFLIWCLGLVGILALLILGRESVYPWGYWMIWLVLASSVILELKTLWSRRV